jgi:hypothetical protein
MELHGGGEQGFLPVVLTFQAQLSDFVCVHVHVYVLF